MNPFPTGQDPIALATRLIYEEAHHLDRQEWDAWLDLYAPDAVFWVPAWRDENVPTADVAREVSLIYHDSRVALEDRVTRIRSNKTVTAMPLPRTTHHISCVLVDGAGDRATVTSNWSVHVYDPRTARQHVLFGRYEHTIGIAEAGSSILRKKITLMNDRIPTMLDFNCL